MATMRRGAGGLSLAPSLGCMASRRGREREMPEAFRSVRRESGFLAMCMGERFFVLGSLFLWELGAVGQVRVHKLEAYATIGERGGFG